MEDLVASLSDTSIESLFPADAETVRFLPHHLVPGASGGTCERA